MEQIDTSVKPTQTQNQPHQVTISKDVEKLQLQEMVHDFMNQQDINKRMRTLVNSSNQKNPRFNVNIDELRQFNPRMATFVIRDPLQALKMFQDTLNENIKGLKEESNSKVSNEKMALNQDNFPKKKQIYYINFEGNFGRNHITPRGLRAELLNQYVTVTGIVTKMSIVKPRLQTSVHYCEETKRGHIKNYVDTFNLEQLALAQDQNGQRQMGFEDNNGFLTADSNGKALSAEYGYCIYRDYQEITIQEMPERAPTGQLPRSIKVILENDLVDKTKPGDRVSVTGIFRASLNAMKHSAITDNYLVACGVTHLNFEKEKPNLDENDIKNIKKLAKDENCFSILGNSIACSIEGNEHVKKALLLQLLGGVEKNLETGTHLRGDINLLMVGDPSTAKSQLLRHIMDIAPLAINTTGRGSTGVGLTAAVTMDKDTGEKHLEAGAMVLADRGVVCIDEFDKMNDCDKVAIHEVMEQQTVTIAKAGMHVSLNARCSVIAAANPIYGDYARELPVGKNIGMPDSLLSRFDLLFVMLDEKDPDMDRKIAQRVIANHRYQAPNTHGEIASVFNYSNDDVIVEGGDMQDFDKTGEKKNVVFEKAMLSAAQKDQQIVTRDFLKKYICYAKSQKSPEISQDIIEYCAIMYAEIRRKASQSDQNTISMPITVRTLETLIRLSTAHAKLRISRQVELKDIDVAYQLVAMSIFQETSQKKTKENPEDFEGEDDEENEHMYDETKETAVIEENKQNTRTMRYESRHGAVVQVEAPKQNVAVVEKQTQKRLVRDEKSPAVNTITPTKKVEVLLASPAKDNGDIRPTKRLRTQVETSINTQLQTPTKDNLEVTKLLAAAPIEHNDIAVEVDMLQKKYIYKLINQTKDGSSRTNIDLVWKAYFNAPDSETMKRGKALVDNKAILIQVVEALEKDNLVMYSNEDGSVILV